jgi:hypothetical protein
LPQLSERNREFGRFDMGESTATTAATTPASAYRQGGQAASTP